MDVLHMLLENEPPEKRVRTWLEQCNFTFANLKNATHVREIKKKKRKKNEDANTVTSKSKSKESSSSDSEDFATSPNGRFNSNLYKEERKKIKEPKAVASRSKSKESFESDSDCFATSVSGRSYSVEESQKILNYIVENDVFPFIKGNILWKRMETEEVCNRTWQSMKSQFISKIYPRIKSFSMQKEEREKLNQIMKSSNLKQNKYLHLEPGQRGWRKNGNYYTESEDLVILNYILQKRRYLLVHGNSLWQTMEEKKILPARTWQSMRSRYLNTIRHSLAKYKLRECDIEKIKNSVKNKEESKILLPHQQHSYQRTILDKKGQQSIRKYAVVASIKLASNMKKSKKIKKTSKNPEKAVHCSAPFLSDLETGSSGTQEYVQNNSPKKNSKNPLSGNGTQVEAKSNSPVETSNNINAICEQKEQVCVEENVSKQNLECASDTPGIVTETCVDNNVPVENSSFRNDACGEKVRANVEENTSVKNVETTCDSFSNGKLVDVKKLPLLENSKCPSVLSINEQPCIESYPLLEISENRSDISPFKTPEYVGNNSPENSLINNGDKLDNDTVADMESNPVISVSKCSNNNFGNETRKCVDKSFPQMDQDISENHNVGLLSTCGTPSCSSSSPENLVYTETVEKFDDDLKMSGKEGEKKKFCSTEEKDDEIRENNNNNNNNNVPLNTCVQMTTKCSSSSQENIAYSETVDKICDNINFSSEAEEREMSSGIDKGDLHCDEPQLDDSSIFSEETVLLSFSECTNTRTSLDCEKCLLDHKLSPSSN